jgi:cytochrome b6-f complex iron-sulfur subunit
VDELRASTRRSFLSYVLTCWIGVILLPVLYAVVQYIIPPALREKVAETIHAARLSELGFNSAEIVRLDRKAIALVRSEQGQVKAFSAVCTHLGCIVQYQAERKVFHCNCHGSEFDMSGKNIAGPAPSPLKPYRVAIKGDDVLISQI